MTDLWRCPICRADSAPDHKFCRVCGYSLKGTQSDAGLRANLGPLFHLNNRLSALEDRLERLERFSVGSTGSTAIEDQVITQAQSIRESAAMLRVSELDPIPTESTAQDRSEPEPLPSELGPAPEPAFDSSSTNQVESPVPSEIPAPS